MVTAFRLALGTRSSSTTPPSCRVHPWLQRGSWARHDGGVVLLERVPRAKQKAVVACVLKAYRKARTAWRNGAVRNGNEPRNEMREEVVA